MSVSLTVFTAIAATLGVGWCLFLIVLILFDIDNPVEAFIFWARIDYEKWTARVETVNNYRWSEEIEPMLSRGEMPWCQGYIIEHYRRNRLLFWRKPVLLRTTHEVIPGSAFVKEGWDEYWMKPLLGNPVPVKGPVSRYDLAKGVL